MLLGDFEITVLTDGTVDQPVDELSYWHFKGRS